MKAPKCRLCGKEHYGACNVTSQGTSNVTPDVILQKDREIERLEAIVKKLESMSPNECPVCTARREANKQRVRAHRERQRA